MSSSEYSETFGFSGSGKKGAESGEGSGDRPAVKKIVRREGKWRLFDKTQTLILMDEKTLDRIEQDPAQPLLPDAEKGVSGEEKRMYGSKTSLIDICRAGRENGAGRLELSYDFFFGGSRRENYPDSPKTLSAYRIICDTAKQYGMDFSASLVSPLDIGGGYAKTHSNTGRTMQFKECAIENGRYETTMDLQTQWTNNKGPVALELKEAHAYAFSEERIEDTPYYYVDENGILDISKGTSYEIDPKSIRVEKAGYGHGKITVHGSGCGCGKDRCLVVLVYRTPELDYFSPDALKYMKSVIDLHYRSGIRYAGFYSDEMHIQFDWDLEHHFGHDTEINTRYVTDNLAGEYAARYGAQYRDFAKYLIYFAYHQHDFLAGEEGSLPSQHVFGRDRDGILRTWRFRKRYYEMLQRRVVDLCNETKKYAESLFGAPIMTRAHSTWQESPTCDHFYAAEEFTGTPQNCSRYDYLPAYQWSSSIREDVSACYDYFKWNEYLTGGGTDHPEGGFLDRDYYGDAFACSLALLNKFPFSYYGCWGGPKTVIRRLEEVGQTFGNQGLDLAHNYIQGLSPRISDVLTIYPLDLNYVEERFGSWMVQYGYTDYITDEKLAENFAGFRDGKLRVKDRSYRALVVFYSPMLRTDVLKVIGDYVVAGGRVIWCSSPVMESGEDRWDLWKKIFGIDSLSCGCGGIAAGGETVRFPGFPGISGMEIPTSLLPDHVYPVRAGNARTAVTLGDKTIGTVLAYPGGGKAVYLGFRPRDDQSRSTGKDIDTLFRTLVSVGCYEENGCEAVSRPEESRYIVNRFENGTVSLANHIRTLREQWYGSFYRDEKKDAEILKNITLPPREVELRDTELLGRKITYSGSGTLSYRLDGAGRLTGFAGEDTTGIAIDGKSYRFSKIPCALAWFSIAESDLESGIAEAWAVRCGSAATVTLPFDASGMACALCGNGLHEAKERCGFHSAGGNTVLDISDEWKGQWIVLFREA